MQFLAICENLTPYRRELLAEEKEEAKLKAQICLDLQGRYPGSKKRTFPRIRINSFADLTKL